MLNGICLFFVGMSDWQCAEQGMYPEIYRFQGQLLSRDKVEHLEMNYTEPRKFSLGL
jgi:hypothetical protein